MGYYVAILRSADTKSTPDKPITREEWLACVKADPEMRVLPAGPMPSAGSPNFRVKELGDYVWWTGLPDVNDEGVVWFHFWKEGFIDVKNPNAAILHKMFEMANRLDARLQGEEGEEYGDHGVVIKAPPDWNGPTPRLPSRSWWQKLLGK